MTKLQMTLQVVLAATLIGLMTLSCSAPGGSAGGAVGSTAFDDGLQVDETTGLVAGMNFDENIDENSPIVIEGALWTTGLSGSALEFNGYDSYVALPDGESLTLADEGTVMVWIYAHSNKAWAGLLHKGELADFSDEAYSLQFYGSSAQPIIYLSGASGGGMSLLGSFGLSTDRWYHIAVAWDAGLVQLHVDGQIDVSTANTIGAIRDSDGRLIAGAQLPVEYSATYGNVGFDGVIDDVGIYDRALTPEEILAIFQELDPSV